MSQHICKSVKIGDLSLHGCDQSKGSTIIEAMGLWMKFQQCKCFEWSTVEIGWVQMDHYRAMHGRNSIAVVEALYRERTTSSNTHMQ